MAGNYDIPNLFLKSFGLKIEKAFSPDVESGKAKDPNSTYPGIEFVDREEAHKLSALGTPILFPITLLADTYRRYDDFGKIEEAPMKEFQLPITCVADFSHPKIVAKTNVSGGKGTVKEIFGFDDWQINIKGLFINEGRQPQGFKNGFDQEQALIKWTNLASSVGVLGDLFAMRDIKSITLGELSVNAVRGRPGLRPFTLPCMSDDPVEFQIDNSNPLNQ